MSHKSFEEILADPSSDTESDSSIESEYHNTSAGILFAGPKHITPKIINAKPQLEGECEYTRITEPRRTLKIDNHSSTTPIRINAEPQLEGECEYTRITEPENGYRIGFKDGIRGSDLFSGIRHVEMMSKEREMILDDGPDFMTKEYDTVGVYPTESGYVNELEYNRYIREKETEHTKILRPKKWNLSDDNTFNRNGLACKTDTIITLSKPPFEVQMDSDKTTITVNIPYVGLKLTARDNELRITLVNSTTVTLKHTVTFKESIESNTINFDRYTNNIVIHHERLIDEIQHLDNDMEMVPYIGSYMTQNEIDRRFSETLQIDELQKRGPIGELKPPFLHRQPSFIA